MRNDDLEYLAGMITVNPLVAAELEAAHAVSPPDQKRLACAKKRMGEEIKVAETAVRVTRALEGRARRSVQLLVAAVTTAAVLAAAWIENGGWPWDGWPW